MVLSDILDNPRIYRLWQAPFARQKLDPVVKSGVLERVRSVLDVGCGPGTNAATFVEVRRYVGIDLNEQYIRFAQRRYQGEFRVADATTDLEEGGQRFDLILMNSLMHHLDDGSAGALLESLRTVATQDGEIHVLDLVMATHGIPRLMAKADRGDHPRTPPEWRNLVEPFLTIQHDALYSVGVGPLELWQMIHMVLKLPGNRM